MKEGLDLVFESRCTDEGTDKKLTRRRVRVG
jgi:hypothetical protein